MTHEEGAPELQGPPEVMRGINEFLDNPELGIWARRPERKLLRAPWTQGQVDALNAFQQLGNYHSYTCPYTHDWRTRRLVATTEGWTCANPRCDYTQDWAHSRAVELGEGALRG